MQNPTTLQTTKSKHQLYHVQTQNFVELPSNLSAIHIGKPNDSIPPDIDLSNFPNSNVVSRIHAKIWIKEDTYFIEDLGSANGTSLNDTQLESGNRYNLKPGDTINFGKDNSVTFVFQPKKGIPLSHVTPDNSEKEQAAFASKVLGSILMLAGIGILASSIVITVGLRNPLGILLAIAGVITLNVGGSYRQWGWILIGIGIAIIIISGVTYASIPLLSLLLAVALLSAGYQLFTSGKIWNFNLLSIQIRR